jgi:hypothetical protein
MSTRTMKSTIALGVAGALAIAAASPSWAAPVPSNTAALKSAAPTETTDVRYFRHRGVGPGLLFGGLALGLAGAALASPYYYDDGPVYGYGYGPGYDYGPGYAYGPDYVGPGWRHHYRRHW